MSQFAKTQRQLTNETTRRTPRRVFTRPIGVLLHGKYSVSQALQLSEGGMLFRSALKLKVKDKLIVTILLPDGGPAVVARGQVLYTKQLASGGIAYGLNFLNLSLHLKRFIRNYVTAKTQEEAEKESEEIDSGGDEFNSGFN